MDALVGALAVRRSPVPTVVVLVALGLALWVPLGQAGSSSDEERSFTVAASGNECPEGKSLCYQVENASPELTPGEEVSIRFENRDGVEHTLHVANGSRSDSERRDTPADAALADTGEVPPGGVATVNVTIPDGDALYLWCDVDDHEANGMWTEVPVSAASESASGPEQGSERIPAEPVGGFLATGTAAWLAGGGKPSRRRGRRDGPS